jgi:hypothetical protein
MCGYLCVCVTAKPEEDVQRIDKGIESERGEVLGVEELERRVGGAGDVGEEDGNRDIPECQQAEPLRECKYKECCRLV